MGCDFDFRGCDYFMTIMCCDNYVVLFGCWSFSFFFFFFFRSFGKNKDTRWATGRERGRGVKKMKGK